jgi:hypothetical protein
VLDGEALPEYKELPVRIEGVAVYERAELAVTVGVEVGI